MNRLESTVQSLENVIKDHDAILSLYNNAVDLNAEYLKEINYYKQHIISLEQKLGKVREERDSLQLATRLIAQDKYCQNEDVTNKLSKQSCGQTTNGEGYRHREWQKVNRNNKNLCCTNINQQQNKIELLSEHENPDCLEHTNKNLEANSIHLAHCSHEDSHY